MNAHFKEKISCSNLHLKDDSNEFGDETQNDFYIFWKKIIIF